MIFRIAITPGGYTAAIFLADGSPTGCTSAGPRAEVPLIVERVAENPDFTAATYTGELAALVDPIPAKFTAAPG